MIDEVKENKKNQSILKDSQQQLASLPESFWDEPRKSYDGSQKTAGELLQMLREHEIGHCNQLYVYLRSKGILPPGTRKRKEAKAKAEAAAKQ